MKTHFDPSNRHVWLAISWPRLHLPEVDPKASFLRDMKPSLNRDVEQALLFGSGCFMLLHRGFRSAGRATKHQVGYQKSGRGAYRYAR